MSLSNKNQTSGQLLLRLLHTIRRLDQLLEKTTKVITSISIFGVNCKWVSLMGHAYNRNVDAGLILYWNLVSCHFLVGRTK